jgi:predicted dehydrogenase
MITRRIRVAVIGVGSMGERHARFLHGYDGVDLIGVVDKNFSKAQGLSIELGCEAYESAEQVLGRVDAVAIATPPTYLAKTGALFIESKIPPLIEKPMAVSKKEFNELVDLSEKQAVPFFVGLLENFCPAIKKAQDYLLHAHIYSLNSQRINPEGNRIVDSDILTDLLLHDLSNAYRFIKSIPISVDVYPVVRRPGQLAEHVTSILRFSDGRLAEFTNSRLFTTERRLLEISSSLGTVKIDLKNQIVQVYTLRDGSCGAGQFNKRPNLLIENLPVRYENPLHNELKAYIDDVRSEKIGDSIEGKAVIPLMEILWTAQEKLKQQQLNLPGFEPAS